MTAVEWLLENLISEPYSEEDFKYNSECWDKAQEMERERTSKLCYGVWRAVKTGANYIYISKDSSILGFVEPLSEEDRLKIHVELFIAIKPI